MKHLYFCSCETDGGIHHYTFERGRLTFCEKVDLDRPNYMIIDGNKAYITVREIDKETGFGGVVTADIDNEGRLINISKPISTEGKAPCHVCVLDGNTYVVNYLSGSVIKLGEKLVTHEGKGVDPDRQEGPHTHFIWPTADQKLLCCDLGLDTVFTYDKDLNVVSTAKVPDGMGVRHLAFANGGKTVYAVNEMGNTVSRFSFENGKLTLIDTVDALPGFFDQSTAAAIRIDGDYLYVSHRGADTIARLKINADGSLKLIRNFPCGGRSPRDFIIADGYILCTNELTNNVSLLKVSDDDLELCGSTIRMPHPISVCQLDI